MRSQKLLMLVFVVILITGLAAVSHAVTVYVTIQGTSLTPATDVVILAPACTPPNCAVQYSGFTIEPKDTT